MPTIVQRAIIDKKCTGLYLSGNRFSNRSLSILADQLYNNRTLFELDLSDIEISDYGIQIFADVLSKNKSALEKLHLGSNGLTDNAVECLVAILRNNRSLTHLMLNRNQITNRGVQILSNVLITQNQTLQVLSLAFNTSINDGSIPSFVEIIKQNQILKGLDLQFCSISDLQNQRLRTIAREKDQFQLFTNESEQQCFIS